MTRNKAYEFAAFRGIKLVHDEILAYGASDSVEGWPIGKSIYAYAPHGRVFSLNESNSIRVTCAKLGKPMNWTRAIERMDLLI
jgi:hypothetical protein